MSTIAFKDKIIAADTRGILGNTIITTRKLFDAYPKGQTYKNIYGFVGSIERGIQLMRWHVTGADENNYPKEDGDENTTTLIVAEFGTVYFYQTIPIKQYVMDNYMAWGSGMEFALGAMAHGATAEEAVRIASKFDVGTGGDIEKYEIPKAN